MNKKIILSALTFCFTSLFFAGEKNYSDQALYNEINLAYKNGNFPEIVEKVNLLQNDFPDSVYIEQALTYKGEAFLNVKCYEESIETLAQALLHMHTGSKLISKVNFLLGKAYYCKNDYKTALEYFHQTCVLSLTDNNLEYYDKAVFYAGKIYYWLELYSQTLPLFEYVVQKGNSYNHDDYNEALQKLMLAYNKSVNFSKTVSLFNHLKKEDFESEFYYTLCLYNADALKNLNKNKEAYDLYCSVIESGYENLAVAALKKAWKLSEQKENGLDPAQFFSKTAGTFKDNKKLVNEFWLRLGINEYEQKNYTEAENYFSNIDEENPLLDFYTAKILVDKYKNVTEAEKLLENFKWKVQDVKIKNFSDSYYSLLLQIKYIEKKWDEIPPLYKKIHNPGQEADYALSASYYAKKEYSKVLPSSKNLYASSLTRLGKYEEALKAWESFNLNESEFCEYAKVLFICGDYEKAFENAQKSNDIQKDYICGLCKINLKEWAESKKYFEKYIKARSGKNDFMNLAFFYKGYAEYCLEEFKNSYASFVRFSTEADPSQISYLKKSYEYAAKSALQNGDFKNASSQAENLIKTSVNQKEKQNAVIFCAEILSDYQNYDKALQLLSPYVSSKSDFTPQALFTSARIYEKKGETEKADSFYKCIYTDYPQNALAEEAMYRTGEIYYTKEDYASALPRLNNYIYTYPSGRFADAALFFGGECALKLGELNRSILLNTTLLEKYQNSVYSYGANKNLLTAYYQGESYAQALKVGQNMVKNFPEESAKDEIGRRVIELEKIVNGSDRQIAEKQSEYEKNGKTSTLKGRISGSELVQLYLKSESGEKEAVLLAEKLLPLQTSDSEREYAAANAEVLADYYRKNSENKKAGQMYLTAARYYRSLNKDSRAAACLYGAAEAFHVQGLTADARETANLLKELYPESRQAQRVESLFNR